MLLFGYNRSTDKISIAQTDGTNKEFHVFSPKIISSIDDLHLNMELEELHRRLLVIPHKSFDAFSYEEKKQYEDFDIHADRIDIDSIHWDGIEDKFFSFWNNSENCKLYAKYRNILTKKGKKEFKHSMKSEQWIISIDLIVTGLVAGTWRNIPDAINHMEKYWDYANSNIFNQSPAIIEHLEAFIEDEVGVQRQMNRQLEEAGRRGIPLIINPQKLKNRLEYHKNRGELNIYFNQETVVKIMSSLGWKLTAKGWVEKR
ncbi:hypothetical protein [Nostoc sp. TCL26-01]|nr:hypothetical protein [Nostoc sp. TCL26-01]QLE54824.1 hypothetical protein FD725_04420 [Nostoc sp. TCL26-01]